MNETVLPYAGTSGWSGSETSKNRAISADESGLTTQRQKETLLELRYASRTGLTWKELATLANLHHGQASGVLSVLHKAGKIERLKATRGKCAIYVLPEFVHDRPTAQSKKTKTGINSNKLIDLNQYIDFLRFNQNISDDVYKGLKAIIKRND